MDVINSRDVLHFLDPQDDRWVNFTESEAQATIFHHPAWIDLLSECYGYRPFVVSVFDRRGRITAGLPMMEVKSRLTGSRWEALPFSDYCTPLYANDASLDLLTQGLISLYQQGSLPKIEVRWRLPPHPAISSVSSFVLHTLNLDPDTERVAKGFSRTHRQNIRTAVSRGVRIEWGVQPEHLRLFFRLHLETRRRKGIPVQPLRFFELLWRKTIQKGLGFILLAYLDESCIAAGLFLHWHQTLTFKYVASSIDRRKLRPNNLLYWTAIRWGCENGYTLFDMGKTDLGNSGLRRFKRGWGATEMSLTYSVLSEKPTRATNAKLMSLMNTLIQRSPVWVCRMLGELLYRHYA